MSNQQTDNAYHQPVMLAEALEGLGLRRDGTYVDATFGGGGHSRAILGQLGPEGCLVAFDQDADAARRVESGEWKVESEARFMFIGDTAGTLGSVGSIEEAVLKSAPVWHFINRGDAESAAVSCRAVDEYLSEETAGETEPSGENEPSGEGERL